MPPRKAKASAKASTSKATATKRKRKKSRSQSRSRSRSSSTERNTKRKRSKSPSQSQAKIPDVSTLNFKSNAKTTSGKKWNLKISSWNINGVRAWLQKNGMKYLEKEDPDIFCIQETKCSDKKLPAELKSVPGYHCFWLAGDKEGYSGVGLLSKVEPLSVKYGIGQKEHDGEGRVITAEYDKFYLVTCYVPNAGRGLVRLDYRMQWDIDFCKYLKKLDNKKHVILCGDMNVAHNEIDLANPKTNKRNAGFTQEERDGFSALLDEGFIDTFRYLYPDEKGAYTFWTYMMNARARNVGWRLDYFVISKKITSHLCDSVIRQDVHGSDHCPVTLFMAY